MSLQQDEASIEEENKLAQRGACIAAALIPIALCCLGGLFTSYTSSGRVLVVQLFLYSTYHGNIAMKGFSDIAQAGCELDRSTPRPETYETDQKELGTRYLNNLRIYQKYWTELHQNDGDPGSFPPPNDIPQSFRAAKSKYCD